MSKKKIAPKTLSITREGEDGTTTISQATLSEEESAVLEQYKQMLPEGTTDEEAFAHAISGKEITNPRLPWWKEAIVQLLFFCLMIAALFIPILVVGAFKLTGWTMIVFLAVWFGSLIVWNRWMTGLWLWQQ